MFWSNFYWLSLKTFFEKFPTEPYWDSKSCPVYFWLAIKIQLEREKKSEISQIPL